MESKIEVLNSDDNKAKKEILKDLIEKFSDQFNFPDLDENNTRSLLWKSLYNILNDDKQEDLHKSCLIIIRLLSREKKSLNELVSTNFLILILTMGGLNGDTDDLLYNDKLIEALKACCNILFNGNISREVCLKHDVLEAIFKRVKSYDDGGIPVDVKILDMKIVFILTALQSDSRVKINMKLNGFEELMGVLGKTFQDFRNMVQESEECKSKQLELIGELLKTLFNLTVQTDIESDLSRDLVIILRDHLLWEFENKNDNNDEINNHIINLLINVPEIELGHLMFECVTEPTSNETLQYMGYDMTAVYTILECFKAKFTKNLTVSKQMELLSPVITVLRNCARSCRRMRKYFKTQVLPPLKDVRSRPEEEESLRGYFCRLLTSPITEVRDLAADFLFILCKENVNRMIKYTGYGNAAGMFASRGLMLGGKTENSINYSSDSEDSDTEEYNELKSQINPVMGCYQPDRPKPTDNMTDEQKEYEAMKLVQLMDNLTRTGIVKPCTVGPDGKPKPVEHVLQLREGLKAQQIKNGDEDSD